MGEGSHCYLPAIAYAGDQILGRDRRVREEHLVERRVAVHLLEWLHVDARLFDVDHKVRQPFVLWRVPIGACEQETVVGMLWRVPIGACEQETVVGMMRTRGPYFLSVDDPMVTVPICACGRAGEVGAAARLAEQLAPGVFSGENAEQKLLFL